MGMHVIQTKLLLSEHRHKPIRGRVLTIGRQSICFSMSILRRLLDDFGIPKRNKTVEIDSSTVHAFKREDWISDRSFWGEFSDAQISALDVTDYEQAEIVHDLSQPLPRELKNSFDFILNGSCLDNIFDPAQAMRSFSGMLRPGGRVFHFEWGNAHPAAYLKYSADWFMDYYAINKFADCKCYILDFPEITGIDHIEELLNAPYGDLWQFDPYVVYSGQVGYECSSVRSQSPYLIFAIAEKGTDSGSDLIPIQKHYRGTRTDAYLKALKKFRSSLRPVFCDAQSRPVNDKPSISDYPVLKLVASWR